MKSYAPSRMAATAASMVPRPVRNTTGQSGSSSLQRPQQPQPVGLRHRQVRAAPRPAGTRRLLQRVGAVGRGLHLVAPEGEHLARASQVARSSSTARIRALLKSIDLPEDQSKESNVLQIRRSGQRQRPAPQPSAIDRRHSPPRPRQPSCRQQRRSAAPAPLRLRPRQHRLARLGGRARRATLPPGARPLEALQHGPQTQEARAPAASTSGRRTSGSTLRPELHPARGATRGPAPPAPACTQLGEPALRLRRRRRDERRANEPEHRSTRWICSRIALRFFSCAGGTAPARRFSFSVSTSRLIESALSGLRTSCSRLSISPLQRRTRRVNGSGSDPWLERMLGPACGSCKARKHWATAEIFCPPTRRRTCGRI